MRLSICIWLTGSILIISIPRYVTRWFSPEVHLLTATGAEADIERIIGHKCTLLSQQAASSWFSLLIKAQNIPDLWVKNGQWAKLLFASAFLLKATLPKEHDKMVYQGNTTFNPLCSCDCYVMSVLTSKYDSCFVITATSPHITVMYVCMSSETWAVHTVQKRAKVWLLMFWSIVLRQKQSWISTIEVT